MCAVPESLRSGNLLGSQDANSTSVDDQAECVEDLTKDMLHSVTTTQECNATSLEQLHTLAGLQ